MKKPRLLLILLIVVFFYSCEEKNKEGTNSLINILEEPAGENCASGGSRILTGIDLNSNGILDDVEVQNSAYICNGANGTNTLVDIVPEAAGENCTNGGYKVISGVDSNGSGILEEGEIDDIEFICNGTEGVSTLLDIIPEPPGENCHAGGYLIISGLDLNDNNILDNNEIENSEYICNGDDGDDYYMFCASIPDDWSCQIYTDAYNTLPKIQAGPGLYLDNPLAIIAYSNDSLGCTAYKSLYLHFYDITMKDSLETIIENSRMYSWCIPMFFGENERYYIITSPCFIYNSCFTEENLEPLFQNIKGLFTNSIIDE